MKNKYDNVIIINEVLSRWNKITSEQKNEFVAEWIDAGHLQEYFYEQGYTDDEGVVAEENCDYERAEEIFFEEYWYYKQYDLIEQDFKKLIID